ncbi:hypothetical protein EJ110_NYTH36795 [Nymphaea thermarum]|nr:hypothetical protein EJ110_NYTH36795 [Nymphaea thermarum]
MPSEDEVIFEVEEEAVSKDKKIDRQTGNVLLQGPKTRNGLYPIKATRSSSDQISTKKAASRQSKKASASFDLWHRRLGHANRKILP